MNADETLRCRIPSTLKRRIEATARSHGETASSWARAQLERAAVHAGLAEHFGAAEAGKPAARSDRVTIRLRPGDGARLRSRAAARCMAPSTYVAALVRRHVGASPPLPQAELQVLKQAMSQLALTTGVLRSWDGEREETDIEAQTLLRELESVRAAVAALVRRNAESWSGDV
jgi:hypothetical protein